MIGNIDVYIRAHVQDLRTGLLTASRDVDMFGRTMLGLNRTTVNMNSRVLWESQRAARSLLAVGAAAVVGVGLAVKTTADFEEQMRNVNSLAQMSEQQFHATGDAVVAMTRGLPQSATEMAKGLYDIVSSGFKGADALNVLNASARAASAGLSDTRTAARAITAVLNAYGPAVGSATYVSDVLFKTVDVGVVTFEELAQNMGQFIGIASQAHVPLEQVGAAYATMTRAGLPAAQASTALMRTIGEFVKPSKELTNLVKQLGYESPYAMLQTLGLAKSVDTLRVALNGNVPAMAAVFRDLRGLRGILALTSQDGQLYANVTQEFSDKQEIAGSTSRALEQQSKSLNYQLKLFRNAVQEGAMSVGNGLVPVVRGSVGGLRSMTLMLANVPAPLKLIVLGVGAVVLTMTSLAAATILIAPRMAAAKVASEELAATMPRLAQATSLATSAIGRLLDVAGAVGILATLYVNMENIANVANRAKFGAPQINDLATALIHLGQAGTQADVNTALGKVSDLSRLGQSSVKAKGENLVNQIMPGYFDEKSLKSQELKDSLRDVDAALGSLVQSGHADLARGALTNLAKSEGLVGHSTDDLVKNYLPQYKSAIGGVTLEATAAGTAVDQFGVAIDDQGQSAEDAAAALKDYEDSIKAMQSELAKFLDMGDAISTIQDAHQRAAKDAEDQANAENAVSDALDRQKEAADKIESAQIKIDAIMARTLGQGPVKGSKEYDTYLQLQKDITDARKEDVNAQKDQKTEAQKYQDKLDQDKVSLSEFTAEMQRQIDAQNKWRANLNLLAGDTSITPDALQALEAMGPTAAGIVDQLAHSTGKAHADAVATLNQYAAQSTPEFAKEVDLEMKVAHEHAVDGAKSTVQDVLTEIQKIAPGITATIPDVRAAMDALGIALKQSSQTGMDALNDIGNQVDSVLNGLTQVPGAIQGTTIRGPADPVIGPVYDPSVTVTYPNVPSIPVTGPTSSLQNPTQLPGAPAGGAVSAQGGTTTIVNTTNYNIDQIVAQDVNDMKIQLEREQRINYLTGPR